MRHACLLLSLTFAGTAASGCNSLISDLVEALAKREKSDREPSGSRPRSKPRARPAARGRARLFVFVAVAEECQDTACRLLEDVLLAG
jgi:hypothetical protein